METTANLQHSIARDEALAQLREADDIAARIDAVERDRENGRISFETARPILGVLHRRVGHAIKAAEVSAMLAVADEIAGLRADLNEEPEPGYTKAGVLVPGRWEDS